MSKTSKIHKIPGYIKHATYGKEIGAFAIDLIFTIGVGIALRYTLGEMAIKPAMGYNEAKASYYQLAEDSGLYTQKDGSLNLKTFEGSGEEYYAHYADYEAYVWNYYFVDCGKTYSETDFTLTSLVSKDGATRTDLATALNVDVNDLSAYRSAVGKYIYESIFSITESDNKNTYFAFAKDSAGQIDYTSAPVLNDEYVKKVNNEDESIRKAAKKDVFDYVCAINPSTSTSSSGATSSATSTSDALKNSLYTKACSDFIKQPRAQYFNSIGVRANYVSSIPSSIIAPMIFFFLIPLFTKNGKTLGKLFLKMSVIGKDGYKASKLQIGLHAFLVLVPFAVLLIPLNSMMTYMIWAFVMVIDYVVLLLSKNHQAVHDMLSQTIVISDKDSAVLFVSSEEEKDYLATHDDEITAAIKESEKEDGKESRNPATINGRKSVVGGAAASGIVDSSTIGAARKEAESMTSFDEFESKDNEEAPAKEAEPSKDEFDTSFDEENDENPELEAMAALDGVETPKEEENPLEEPSSPHDDGFVDEAVAKSKESNPVEAKDTESKKTE